MLKFVGPHNYFPLDIINANGFTFFYKVRIRLYSAETIIEADYINDQALLENTSTQTEFPVT